MGIIPFTFCPLYRGGSIDSVIVSGTTVGKRVDVALLPSDYGRISPSLYLVIYLIISDGGEPLNTVHVKPQHIAEGLLNDLLNGASHARLAGSERVTNGQSCHVILLSCCMVEVYHGGGRESSHLPPPLSNCYQEAR